MQVKSINFTICKTEMENADQCFNQVPQKSPNLNLPPQIEACLGFRPEETETVPILRSGLLEGKFWESAEPHMLNSFSDIPN